jgi:two-component system chemotaxis response regulator CheB
MDEKVKVLIVDDAAFMRKTVRKIFESDRRFTVVGTAQNGEEAIKLNHELKPDLVTLDIDMPVMDGITALKNIMISRSVPVIIVSSLSYETNVTFESFRLGVMDFIPKPTGAISQELEKQKEYLCDVAFKSSKANIPYRVLVTQRGIFKKEIAVPTKALVILAASLGGPAAIMRVLCNLPSGVNCAIVGMMQISAKVMDSLVQKLNQVTFLKVFKSRQERTILNNGEVYLHGLDQPCPTVVQNNDGTYALEYLPKAVATPIDTVMESAAKLKQAKLAGIIMSGTGQDGLKGIKEIYQKSGKILIQKINDAMFPEKPQLAIQQGVYHSVLSDHEICEYLAKPDSL